MSDGPEKMLLDVMQARRSVRSFASAPVTSDQVQRLLWAGQGTTGTDGLKTVPSAHALHPLRLVVVAGHVTGLEPGLYQAGHRDGSLDQLSKGDTRNALKDAAVEDQTWISDAPLTISVCADFVTPTRDFADQKPYGRRGPTYVAIEAGAAAQNMMLMAVSLGLGSVLVAGFDDDETARILGLEAPYSPVLHLSIGVPLPQ
ncbi:MAG: SagB/ThcOx family dehydrogenase [Pseudomonadota bacterium]